MTAADKVENKSGKRIIKFQSKCHLFYLFNLNKKKELESEKHKYENKSRKKF